MLKAILCIAACLAVVFVLAHTETVESACATRTIRPLAQFYFWLAGVALLVAIGASL